MYINTDDMLDYVHNIDAAAANIHGVTATKKFFNWYRFGYRNYLKLLAFHIFFESILLQA
ncbi:hypothetical protein ACJJIU_10925 [Microbulbifer sp. CnH-101-E]|uniref:hypothetical protein n=1 Tax=unclassified Microbulbifer TaxID=2619833 RepID=UPI004038FE7A